MTTNHPIACDCWTCRNFIGHPIDVQRTMSDQIRRRMRAMGISIHDGDAMNADPVIAAIRVAFADAMAPQPTTEV